MEFNTAVLASLLVGGFALTYFTRMAFPNMWKYIFSNQKVDVKTPMLSQSDALETILLEGAGSTNIDMHFQKGTKINVKGQQYFIEGEIHLTSSELVSDFSTLQEEIDKIKNNVNDNGKENHVHKVLDEENKTKLTGNRSTFSKRKPKG